MTNFSNRGKNLHLGVANAEGGGKWGEYIGFLFVVACGIPLSIRQIRNIRC